MLCHVLGGLSFAMPVVRFSLSLAGVSYGGGFYFGALRLRQSRLHLSFIHAERVPPGQGPEAAGSWRDAMLGDGCMGGSLQRASSCGLEALGVGC